MISPWYFSSNRGDFLIISVTGNFLCAFRSKKSSSVKKPATETSSHLDALKSSLDINLKSGKLFSGIESFFNPSKNSLDAYFFCNSDTLLYKSAQILFSKSVILL